MNEKILEKERELFFSENCIDIEKYHRDPVYHAEVTAMEIQYMRGIKKGLETYEELVNKYSELSEKYTNASIQITNLRMGKGGKGDVI